jgi:hypothetical protein
MERRMPAPPNSELFSIDPEVLAVLGKTVDEIADMTAREFADLSYSKGIEWTVSAEGGRIRGLTMTFNQSPQVASV